MVDRDAVYAAAAELQKDGSTVTVRSVRAFLGNKGSNRDLGRFVGDWKADNPHHAHDVGDGIPVDLQGRQNDFLAALWASARALAKADFEEKQRQMHTAIRANNEVRDEALQEADRLAEQVGKLEAEVGRLQSALQRSTAHVERMRAEEFWTRLMGEVADILPFQGSMTAEEILPRIRLSARREAIGAGETLTAKLLQKKMSTRAEHGKLFKWLEKDGAFARCEETPKGVRRRVHPQDGESGDTAVRR